MVDRSVARRKALLDALMPLWQERFFDHLLRSQAAYAEKYDYVIENPVRASLVPLAKQWPYQGSLADIRVDDVERM